MIEQVAKIEQLIADELLANVDFEIDVVAHKYGFLCTNAQDALDLLNPKDYELVDWLSYQIDGLEIGVPRPRKPRK